MSTRVSKPATMPEDWQKKVTQLSNILGIDEDEAETELKSHLFAKDMPTHPKSKTRLSSRLSKTPWEKAVDEVAEMFGVSKQEAAEGIARYMPGASEGRFPDQLDKHKCPIEKIATKYSNNHISDSHHLSPEKIKKLEDTDWQKAISKVADLFHLNARDAAEAIASFWPGGSKGEFISSLTPEDKKDIKRIAGKYLQLAGKSSVGDVVSSHHLDTEDDDDDTTNWQQAVEFVAKRFDLNARKAAEALATYWPGGSDGSFDQSLTPKDKRDIRTVAEVFLSKDSQVARPETNWQKAVSEVVEKYNLSLPEASQALAVFYDGGSEGSFVPSLSQENKRDIGDIANKYLSMDEEDTPLDKAWQTAVSVVEEDFDLSADQAANSLSVEWSNGNEELYDPSLTEEERKTIDDIAKAYKEFAEAHPSVKINSPDDLSASGVLPSIPSKSRGSRFPRSPRSARSPRTARTARTARTTRSARSNSPSRDTQALRSSRGSRPTSPVRSARAKSPSRSSLNGMNGMGSGEKELDISMLRNIARELGVNELGTRKRVIDAIKSYFE